MIPLLDQTGGDGRDEDRYGQDRVGPDGPEPPTQSVKTEQSVNTKRWRGAPSTSHIVQEVRHSL
jgi:hypothetical protein